MIKALSGGARLWTFRRQVVGKYRNEVDIAVRWTQLKPTLAPGPGFEPGLEDSKSSVLPLNDPGTLNI